MAFNTLPRMDRRTALKWMLAAAASTALSPSVVRGDTVEAAPGYGTAPDLLRHYRPGEIWPLTFTDGQRQTAAALCDTIIPADDSSPAASAVGVVDFIDEWISAPYPVQQADRVIVLAGIMWIEQEAWDRFANSFVSIAEAQRTAICDDVCDPVRLTSGREEAAKFFSTYRNLTAGGYFTTPAGRKDLGYVGNMPLATFDGPPPEVLRRAGLL